MKLTTKKGFCMYKIATVYLITDNFLKKNSAQILHVFIQHGDKRMGNYNIRDI